MSAPSSKPYHSTWKVQPGCGLLFGMPSISPSGAIFTVPLLPAGSPLPPPLPPPLPLPPLLPPPPLLVPPLPLPPPLLVPLCRCRCRCWCCRCPGAAVVAGRALVAVALVAGPCRAVALGLAGLVPLPGLSLPLSADWPGAVAWPLPWACWPALPWPGSAEAGSAVTPQVPTTRAAARASDRRAWSVRIMSGPPCLRPFDTATCVCGGLAPREASSRICPAQVIVQTHQREILGR